MGGHHSVTVDQDGSCVSCFDERASDHAARSHPLYLHYGFSTAIKKVSGGCLHRGLVASFVCVVELHIGCIAKQTSMIGCFDTVKPD